MALEESISDTSPSGSSVLVPPPPSAVPTPTSNMASGSTRKSDQHAPNDVVPIHRRPPSPPPDARSSKRPRLSPAPAAAQWRDAPSAAEWPCAACTFLNTALALQCSVCLTIRPLARGADWLCLGCGQEANEARLWTCKGCGKMKTKAEAPC